jgi:hypothetical protein
MEEPHETVDGWQDGMKNKEARPDARPTALQSVIGICSQFVSAANLNGQALRQRLSS